MDSKLEAVISGIAGKFPECFSVDELWERLLSKSVLIKQDDFMTKLNIHNESDQFSRGLMPEWNKFDNQFFGVPYLLVRNCEPVLGMFLEKTFEALLDSGINPFSLKGRNVAVLAALSTSDVEVLRYSSGDLRYGIGMVGQSRAMLANRISYFFNFTGPSYTTDSSWLGAMYCLKKAADLVSSGVVEAAVVATASKLLSPVVDKQYRALGLIAGDGVCQPFDNEGHGFVRSEAAVVFFIQGRKDAKRIYATLKKAETKFIGAKNCSFIQLDPEVEKFLRNFYSDRNENPEDVSYIEAHGTCFKDTDAQELNALAGVFCSQKETPQLIGSITGNVGNTESCCGLVAIVKVIMAMEHGVIPPTVNYHTPNLAVPALLSGKLKPVTEKTELLGDLVAVNTLSVSNAVSHVLLKRHDKVKKTLTKTNELPEDGLPRLVLLQARNEQGAKMICDKISSMPVDVEFISMVNDAFNHQIPAYLWRGYTVVPSDITSPALKIQQFKAEKRPLWFVFSGMGSQWIGMGKELLQIPVFKLSVEKCDEVLRPKGVDIFHILSSNDPSVYDNILNCFVGINAIQIGLMDVLKELKITPDGIIGHSVGELGCAYADGCFTAEETILAAYARGKASLDSLDDDYIKGSMAAVGLSYDNIKHKLPPSIDVACHNSQGSCTLSGPTNDIVNFVEKLSSEGVFARAVSAGGIAYHSRYIRTIAPKLLNALKEIIASPKPRSSKWISTSVPESQWDTDGARLCSAEYHTNNLLNPVYFQEGCKHLPDDAILLEIAPHGLLQAILRRAVKPSSQCLSLTSRTVQSNLKHLLNCLGELHLNNVSVDINALYPKVEYPVSRGTPSLATLATWEHQSGHYSEVLSIIRTVFSVDTFERTKHVSATDPEYQLWKEHRFAGQVVLPFPQILMYPLDMILTSIHQNIEQHCTVIEDVIIGNNVSIDEVEKEIYTTYYPSTLKFEVYCNSTNILSGKVVESQSKSQALTVEPVDNFSITEVTCGDEIYHTLSELGYDVGPQFKLIKNIDFGKKECIARVKWNGNMITFLDSLIKIVIIFESRERNMLLIPKAITKMTVDGPCLRALSYEAELEVLYQSWCSRIVCKGAELVGLSFKATKLMDFFPLAWAELKFQPYFDNSVKVNEFLSSSVETAAEDGLKSWADDSCIINILILNTEENCFQYSHLRRHLMSRSNIEVKVLSLDFESAKKELDKTERKTMIVVGDYDSISGLLDHSEETDQLYCVTHISGSDIPKFSQRLRLVSAHKTDSGRLVLLKRVTLQEKFHLCSIESSGWLSALRNFVEKEKKKNEPILVVTRNLTPRELLPVLSKEPFAYRIRTVFIEDRDAPQFSLSSSFYSSQLSLGLPVNILSGGVWGSLRKVSLDISPCNLNLDSLVNR